MYFQDAWYRSSGREAQTLFAGCKSVYFLYFNAYFYKEFYIKMKREREEKGWI